MVAFSAACAKNQTVNHIFSECVFAQFLWCCLRDACGWTHFPVSVHDLIHNWLPRRLGVPQRVAFFIFAGLAWAIRNNRNKMAIENIFPSNPFVVIYVAMKSLQMWGELLKEDGKSKLIKAVNCLEGWIKQKESVADMCSDVVFLRLSFCSF